MALCRKYLPMWLSVLYTWRFIKNGRYSNWTYLKTNIFYFFTEIQSVLIQIFYIDFGPLFQLLLIFLFKLLKQFIHIRIPLIILKGCFSCCYCRRIVEIDLNIIFHCKRVQNQHVFLFCVTSHINIILLYLCHTVTSFQVICF